MTLAPYLDTHKAIIGTSGAGKTVTAKDEVEALLTDRRHLCILDPTGAWWGLRSNSAGDGPGFDIPIFGGDHGDVGIEPDQGEAVGAIIAGGVSAIVDVSAMDGREQRRFVLGLMRALRRKPKGNFHLVVDEADEFAPQTAPDDFGFQLAEQMAWVAKRGRLAGFVLTAITQRPADITKAVLSQVQTVIAHQLIAPQDQKAIGDYLKANGDAATRKTVMASLAKLERGERWVYSPRLGLLERGMTPMPSTFDSSRTPEPGEAPVEPRMLAQIDIGAIRAALAPKVQVSDDSGQPATSDAAVKAALAKAEVDRLEWAAHAKRLEQDRDYWKGRAEARLAMIQRARTALQEQDSNAQAAAIDRVTAREPSPAPAKAAEPRRERLAPTVSTGGGAITGPQQRILDALAWWVDLGHATVTNEQAAFVAGYVPNAGGFNNPRGALKMMGHVTYPLPGSVALTESGIALANAPAVAADGDQLRQIISAKLNGPQRRIFDVVVEAYPDSLSNDEAAQRAGYAPNAGGYNNPRGSLKMMTILTYPQPGHVRASDWLFP